MNEIQHEYELSIVTVTFNAEKELKKTIASICAQDIKKNAKIQYIVQDGLSTDKTLSVAENNRAFIENKGIFFSVFSEKDDGIYDAMNKGIQKAEGKWICLLNAGDIFHDFRCLSVLLDCLEKNDADIVYADYCRVNPYGLRLIKIPELHQLQNKMIFCHQATIVKKSVYSEIVYDIRYRFAADYDFFLNCFQNGKSFHYFECYLIDYDLNGKSANNMVNTYKEIYKVRVDNQISSINLITKLRYMTGIVKRRILCILPQGIRWPIINFIHKLSDKFISLFIV